MEKIKLRVTGNQIEVAERPAVITAGTVGLAAEFTFDSQWDKLTKTAVFKAGEKVIATALEGDAHTVPWEVLEKPNAWLCVGVYGANADGTVVIPTLWAKVAVVHTGTDPEGDPALEPTAPVWQEVLSRLEGVTAEGVGAATREEMDVVQDHLLSLNDEFYSHRENMANPHGVTAEQIGAVTQEKHDTDIGELRGWAEDEIALQVESLEHQISAAKKEVEDLVAENKAIIVTVASNISSLTTQEIYDAVVAGKVVYLKMWSSTYTLCCSCTPDEAKFESSYSTSVIGADGKSYACQAFRMFVVANTNKVTTISNTTASVDYINAQIAYYLGDKEA